MTGPTMVAIVVVRDGALPPGAVEAVAEAGGRTVLVGTHAGRAAEAIAHVCARLDVAEVPSLAARGVSAALAASSLLDDVDIVVFPASIDGRDLAPRVAAALGRPLYANAARITPTRVTVVRPDGRAMQHLTPPRRFVATLLPGARGPGAPNATAARRHDRTLTVDVSGDAHVVGVLAPDPATIDLSEASRIVAGGAGLDSAARFDQLAQLGAHLRASVGATRVITDRGWVGHERQIGTTGVVVHPELYLAFGISGAVQHTSGLGHPAHVIAVNTDPHCPMMAMADVAIVADANAVLDALADQLADAPAGAAAAQQTGSQ